MPLLSSKNKSQRPKFLLYLKIDELINIPQSSGYCYVKWNLKDGTGTSNHRLRSSGEDENNMIGHQNHGVTPRVAVEHHRVRWNYQLKKPIEVKLQVDKTRNLEAKRLVLDIYFELLENGNESNNDGSAQKTKRTSLDIPNAVKSPNNVYSPKVSNRSQLGSVILNIAEYVREDEQPITNRFLLKKSKVNSIINLTLQMKLTRGSYDDFLISKASSSQPAGGVRLGIDDILDDASEKSSPASSTFQGSTSGGGSPRSNHHTRSLRSSLRFGSGNHTNNSNGGSGNKAQSYMGMGSPSSPGNTTSSSMNPLVEHLYQKTFQLPWDPRPGEFTPKECVEDILQGGNGWARNEKGINLIDIQALKLIEMEVEYQDNQRYGANEKMNATKRMELNTSADEYNSMDKREFLEKMHSWSHTSQNQKRMINNENSRGNALTEGGAGQSEPINADRIRDARTWTINSILA
ncbi:hypothetical protein ZYGR_0E01750 [Zygosaccharomyces rouxii]|uniref:ZYRO0B03894p n=2 Tax=Zygosaccharomyces rouxii TaxID=4956 RepID=C5DQY0_ZYGRC|nr:uncharacterized protein ZYRO0B03894g [Zygosaccharomyces rouxii]KAH9200260.1 N-terminal C2 in EEIG1 and EHBP1 proteins-domain-containing protein [Zygosaccharomyces rouxii]GAV47159.1 hypothetical protein ZYGR_0E01750 [Zygosaccharomyces rouxii]CAR26191.1 ZYRO0B03894p [Zygosaccharomyces rouxii]